MPIETQQSRVCFRCDEPAVGVDESDRPLCARHTMIFVTAPRILAAAEAGDAVPGREAVAHRPESQLATDLPSEEASAALVVDLAPMESPVEVDEFAPRPLVPSGSNMGSRVADEVVADEVVADEVVPASDTASGIPTALSPVGSVEASADSTVQPQARIPPRRSRRPLPSQRQRRRQRTAE
jgi:hypothetical protein